MSAHDRPQWDTDGEPFDGRFAPFMHRRQRRPSPRGHGPDCSSNPEIGCVCDGAERAALRAEERERADGPMKPSRRINTWPFWSRPGRQR